MGEKCVQGILQERNHNKLKADSIVYTFRINYT